VRHEARHLEGLDPPKVAFLQPLCYATSQAMKKIMYIDSGNILMNCNEIAIEYVRE
jgi:diadenosine tetraphosphate (Ap4A) HIT family hydrolase